MSDDYKVKFDGVFGWAAEGDKAVYLRGKTNQGTSDTLSSY